MGRRGRVSRLQSQPHSCRTGAGREQMPTAPLPKASVPPASGPEEHVGGGAPGAMAEAAQAVRDWIEKQSGVVYTLGSRYTRLGIRLKVPRPRPAKRPPDPGDLEKRGLGEQERKKPDGGTGDRVGRRDAGGPGERGAPGVGAARG